MISNTIHQSTYYLKHVSPISKRETEVLRLIAHGLSSHEIANQLYIGLETVKSHRRSLLSKMDASNSASLVRVGFELGYLN